MRVLAGGVWRIQEVSGGSATSQNSLPVEFGLGVTATIDSLVVRWPSGIVQALAPPAVDRIVTVVEGPAVTIAIGDRSVAEGINGTRTLTVYAEPVDRAGGSGERELRHVGQHGDGGGQRLRGGERNGDVRAG